MTSDPHAIKIGKLIDASRTGGMKMNQRGALYFAEQAKTYMVEHDLWHEANEVCEHIQKIIDDYQKAVTTPTTETPQ